MRYVFLTVILAATTASAETPEEKGLQIARRADQAQSGFKSEKADMTMDLINAHGDVTTRKMTLVVSEGTDDGDKSRSEFLWPADVKGTKLLTWTHKQGDDDQWLYLPAVKRVKRIASSNKSGAFMGSEFTYEDLTPFVLAKYAYVRLPDAVVDGTPCYQVERRPKTEDSGYSRQIVALDTTYLSPVKLESYDRRNELLKVALYRNPRMFGSYRRHDLLRMENRQTGKVSELRPA